MPLLFLYAIGRIRDRAFDGCYNCYLAHWGASAMLATISDETLVSSSEHIYAFSSRMFVQTMVLLRRLAIVLAAATLVSVKEYNYLGG